MIAVMMRAAKVALASKYVNVCAVVLMPSATHGVTWLLASALLELEEIHGQAVVETNVLWMTIALTG